MQLKPITSTKVPQSKEEMQSPNFEKYGHAKIDSHGIRLFPNPIQDLGQDTFEAYPRRKSWMLKMEASHASGVPLSCREKFAD